MIPFMTLPAESSTTAEYSTESTSTFFSWFCVDELSPPEVKKRVWVATHSRFSL